MDLTHQDSLQTGGRRLLRNEKFGFKPKHTTTLQLTRLVERVSRNFGENRLTVAVFLDATNAFDTAWVDGLLYKLRVLIFLRTFPKPYLPT